MSLLLLLILVLPENKYILINMSTAPQRYAALSFKYMVNMSCHDNNAICCLPIEDMPLVTKAFGPLSGEDAAEISASWGVHIAVG